MTLRRTPLFLVIFALTIIISTIATIQPVKALGVIYINPSSQGPATTSTVTYSVKVASIDPFTGWDIAVQTDPTVLNPQTITAYGINLLQRNYTVQAFELINCVNNVGKTCQAGVDGPGIAHSFLNIASLPPMSTPTSGLLFNITYSVLKPSYSSVLHIFNDQIFNGSPNLVGHTSTDGTYNNPPIFTINPSPQSLTIYQGGSATSTLSLTSINSFAGTVLLSAAVSNSTLHYLPTATLSVPSATLTSGGTNTAIVTISVSASTNTGKYSVILNATTPSTNKNPVPFSVFPVIAVYVPDFNISAIPHSVPIISPGTSGSSTITATSLNGFQGTVTLAQAVTGGPVGACPGIYCPMASLSSTSLTLLSGGSATSTLTVSITSSTPLGAYVLTITATATKVASPHILTIPVYVKVQPSIQTVIKSSSGVAVTLVPLGTTVHDNATLTGATTDAGGSLTYNLFSKGDCTGTPTIVGSQVVTNGVVPGSVSQQFNILGTFGWDATYSGDTKNNIATGVCEPLTIQASPTSPTIVTAIKDSTGSKVTSIIVGTTVHDNSTLSSAFSTAGGTVIYAFWNTGACTGTRTVVSTVTVTNAIVPDSATITFNSVGSFSFNATYSGDTGNNPATSPCEPLTVNKASPTLTTTIKDPIGTTVSVVLVGTMVHDTAALSTGFSPGAVGSTVTYTLFSFATLPSATAPCSGGTVVGTAQTVTITTAGVVPDASAVTPAVGTYGYSATFNGDANNNAATSNCEPLTVLGTKPTPTLATIIKDPTGASVNSIPAGTTVHDTGTLMTATSNAGGTVIYASWNTATCTGAKTIVSTVTVTNGIVPDSASQPFSAIGSFSWNATYSGDTNNNPATSPCELLTVAKANPTVATIIKNSAGTPITSIGPGTSTHDTATISASTNTAGGTVTYAFWNTGACIGTRTVVSTVTVTNAIVPDSAAVTFNSLGSFSFNATYSGDLNNNPAMSICEPLTVKVSPTIATIIKDSTKTPVSSISVGITVHDTATLAGATSNAGGTVTYTVFTNNACTGSGTPLSTVTVMNGIFSDSAPTTPTPAGLYSISVAYSGDAVNNAAISPCEPLTVNKVSPTLTTKLEDSTGAVVTSITVGSAIQDKAALSNSFQASGLVAYTLFNNGACIGLGMTVSTVTVANGVVPDFTSQLFNTPGFFSINATYSGDINNNGAQSKCEPLTVKAVPTLATIIKSSTGANVNSVLAGSSVHDTALLSGGLGKLNGTVIYFLFPSIDCATGGTIVSTVTVTNDSVPDSTAVTFNIAGSFSWVAFYSGDTNNAETASLCAPLIVTSPNLHIDSLMIIPNPANTLPIGQLITFKVVIENNGTADAAFQIVIKWGSTAVATQNASLSPGRNQTFTLTWDTSKSIAGTSKISVIVPKVQGETITTDHIFTGSSLTLAPPLPVTLLLLVGLPIAVATTTVVLYLLLRRRKARMQNLASSRSNGSEKIVS